jgi:hypothetical protein
MDSMSKFNEDHERESSRLRELLQRSRQAQQQDWDAMERLSRASRRVRG